MTTQTLSSFCSINPESLDPATPVEFMFDYIDISSVTRGRISWDDVRRVIFKDAPSRARRRLRSGDVLLCTVRPALQAHARISDDNGVPRVASTGFAALRPNNPNDASYIFHQLFSDPVGAQLRAMETGSNYPAVSERDVSRIVFFTPSVEERARIGAVLDTVDAAIDKTAAVIAKLKQVRAGLLHDLLTRGLDENGELRDPIAHPQQFTDTALGRLPKDWELIPAKRLSHEITKGTTPSMLSSVEKRGWVPFIRVQNLTFDGTLSFEDDKSFLPPEIHLGLRRSLVIPGDVLMNLVGPPMGKVSIVPPTYPEWNINQAIAIFRTLDVTAGRYFAFYLLSTLAYRWFMRNAKKTSGQMNLTLEMCRGLPVPWQRNPAERSAITDRLLAIDRQIGCEQHFEFKLRHLKAGLSSDLLTGRVPVAPNLETGVA